MPWAGPECTGAVESKGTNCGRSSGLRKTNSSLRSFGFSRLLKLLAQHLVAWAELESKLKFADSFCILALIAVTVAFPYDVSDLFRINWRFWRRGNGGWRRRWRNRNRGWNRRR